MQCMEKVIYSVYSRLQQIKSKTCFKWLWARLKGQGNLLWHTVARCRHKQPLQAHEELRAVDIQSAGRVLVAGWSREGVGSPSYNALWPSNHKCSKKSNWFHWLYGMILYPTLSRSYPITTHSHRYCHSWENFWSKSPRTRRPGLNRSTTTKPWWIHSDLIN